MNWSPLPAKRIAFFLVLFVTVGIAVCAVLVAYDGLTGTHDRFGFVPGVDTCNVTGVDIHGCLLTYMPSESHLAANPDCNAITTSEEVVSYLRDAKEDTNVKAILLDIDSGGGMPQAAVEIEAAMKDTGKPVVALIRGNGDSAAYWIASGAGTIIASKESDVGSIGVTSSYVDNVKQNAETGLTYNSLSTGKFKDTGDPNKPLTDEEKAYLRKSLVTSLEHFIQTVAVNRHLSIEKVRALADGSTMLGDEALANGLIDQLGTYPEAFTVLQGLVKAEPRVCWPKYEGS